MCEAFGGWIKIDIVTGSPIDSQMVDQGGTKGCLHNLQRSKQLCGVKVGNAHTLPAPAGPMTIVPNLLLSKLGGEDDKISLYHIKYVVLMCMLNI